jgi:hypothetical protein
MPKVKYEQDGAPVADQVDEARLWKRLASRPR